MDVATQATPAKPTMRRVEQAAVIASDETLRATMARVDAVLAQRQALPLRVEIRLDDNQGFIVDGAARRTEPLGGAVDCGFQIGSKDLSRIAGGELEPRHAILFGHAKILSGEARDVVAFCDWLAGRTVSQTLETNQPLPTPTRDWDRARRDLDLFGYALVEGALSPEEVKALRDRTVEQAQGEVEAGVATISAAAQHLWSLLNKGRIYHDLLLNPLIEAFVPHRLGEYFVLNSITGSIALPGNSSSTMHLDQSNVQPAIPDFPVGLNILWFLDDVTDANGGTRLMPGSHTASIAPADPFDTAGTIAAEGPAGSALLLDSRVWHSVGRNSTDRRRHVVVTYFNRSYMRTHENHFLSLLPEVEASLDEKVQVMVGFRCTVGMGAVEEPVEGKMSARLAHPIGVLEPSAPASV